MRKLYQLLAANKGRGSPMAVIRNAGEMTIEVYDVIVSSEADAAWFGGVPADAFCRAMRQAGADDTVRVRINSPGGDVFAGVAMAQAIRECAGKVVVHVDGYAASAASLLVAAAPESVIAQAGMVMIHKAWTIAMGNADDFAATADLLNKIDGMLAETYQGRAGGDAADWLAAMAAETWYTGAEAVAAGLVTAVAEDAARTKNSFDLSVYAHAPSIEAREPADDAEQENQTTTASDVAAVETERRRNLSRLSLATAA
jgi:ATP-dependent protease ClpP protease subunit